MGLSRGAVAKSRPPLSPHAAGALHAAQELLPASPDPALLLDTRGGILVANAAAELFFRRAPLTGAHIDQFLKPGGLDLQDVPVSGQYGKILSAESRASSKLVVRRIDEELDRLLFISPLAGESGPCGAIAIVEGGLAHEDLVQLRAKAREVAHGLNNIVMTAIGNLSLARVYARQPEELQKQLVAAEANLMKVSELTRSLQQVAKKDLPSA
jgi:hypothetical protein